jgi:hypothetical protein
MLREGFIDIARDRLLQTATVGCVGALTVPRPGPVYAGSTHRLYWKVVSASNSYSLALVPSRSGVSVPVVSAALATAQIGLLHVDLQIPATSTAPFHLRVTAGLHTQFHEGNLPLQATACTSLCEGLIVTPQFGNTVAMLPKTTVLAGHPRLSQLRATFAPASERYYSLESATPSTALPKGLLLVANTAFTVDAQVVPMAPLWTPLWRPLWPP